jgi:hypothetical protein
MGCDHTGVIDYVGGVGPVCHDCQQHVIKDSSGAWVTPPQAPAAGPKETPPIIFPSGTFDRPPVEAAAPTDSEVAEMVRQAPGYKRMVDTFAAFTADSPEPTTPRKGVADPAIPESSPPKR